MKLKEHNPLQNLEELNWYAKFTKDLGVTKYLEIGTDQGCTMYAVLANSPKGSLGVAIDLNDVSFIDSRLRFTFTKQELLSLGYKVEFLQGDSKELSVIEQAKLLGPYDLVFIDGDHSYEGVKADWDNYSSLAPVVVIHDVCGRDNPYTNTVHKFWEELKRDKKYIEVNFSNYQLGYGVVFK